ncbi:hypothetical protein Mgra_00007282, partial [Meloidogyne graminicola]
MEFFLNAQNKINQVILDLEVIQQLISELERSNSSLIELAPLNN